jgi:hypothetical protein
MVTWKVCALILSASSNALLANTATPYQSIVDRNIFGLKPPPPPTAAAEAPRTPLPPITLNGITTLQGIKRAFLSMQAPAKPPEPAKPQSFMLSEGERDGDIEMIEIDVKGGSVKINAFGTITNVPFPKITASSPAPGAAGMPGSAGAKGIPAPPPNPFAPSGFQQRAIPSRTLRMPGVPNANGAAANAQGMQPGGSQYPGSQVNGATLNGGVQASTAGLPDNHPDVVARQPKLSTEEDAIITEGLRQKYPNGPPLPPTALTSPEDLQKIMAPGSTFPSPRQRTGSGF